MSSQNTVSNQQTIPPTMSEMTSPNTVIKSISFLPHSTADSGPQDHVVRGTGTSRNGPGLSPFVPIRQSPSVAQTNVLKTPLSSDSILSNSFMPTFAEADTILGIFRDQMTPQFPFIIIPQSLSAERLYLERPFLYISILAVTSRDSVQQQGLGKLVIKQLAEKLFVNSERSLDLLLGVLTYAGWFVCHFFITSNPWVRFLSLELLIASVQGLLELLQYPTVIQLTLCRKYVNSTPCNL